MNYLIININEVPEVRACRGCLAMRCELHDIREKRLKQVFSDLTGFPISDGLLCTTCLYLVNKFKDFRMRCRKSGYLFNMFALNQDALSSVDRSNLIVPLSQSRMLHIDCKSTRELITTDVLHINVPDDTDTMDSESNSTLENTSVKIENVSKIDNLQNICDIMESTECYDSETSTHIDNAENEENDIIQNNLNKTDKFIEPTIPSTVKKTKSKVKKDRIEWLKYFKDIWKAVSKANGDPYQMFERLYKFSKVKERPEYPNVFRKKETKSETYNFLKFLNINKEIADFYKVDVDFISIMEEKRAMDEKRRTWMKDYDDWKCVNCGRKYLTSGTYERHLMRSHNEAHRFQCAICLYTFQRETSLAIHLFKYHCTKRKCQECDILIVDTSDHVWQEVCEHINTHHLGNVTTCEFCGKTFAVAKNCYYHIRSSHRSEMDAVQCWLCGDFFNGPRGVWNHIRKIHMEAVKCATCGVYFKDKETMAAHVTATGECQKDVSGCPMCGATFPTKSLMKEHYDDIHAKYKCVTCLQTFIEYECYRVHLFKICSANEKLPKQRTEEDIARSKKRKMKNANKPKSIRKKPNATKPESIGKRNYVCEICGKGFLNQCHLRYHFRLHTGEKPFKCEHCDKSFRLAVSLQTHKWTHTGERHYKCTLCPTPKSFRQPGHLKRHIEIQHSDKRFTCDVCEKQYKSKPSLTHHIQSVHMGMQIPPRQRKPRNK